MRLAAVATVVMLVMACPVTANAPDLRLSEIHPHPTDEGREFIEIHNPTSEAVNLAGWTVADAAGNTFTFPQWTLAAGAHVVVWGGGASDPAGPAWGRATAWNNGGDTAFLRNPSGVVVDQLTYGSSETPAPPQGMSLDAAAAWSTAEATPGRAHGTQGGHASATVENLPPDARVTAPATAHVGQIISLTINVTDANGDAVSWVLHGQQETRAGTGSAALQWTVPDRAGTVTWTLEATDGNHTVTAQATTIVEASGLQLTMPPGGLAFPTLTPGATHVQAAGAVRLANHGNEIIRPRLDVSPLSGPATIPLEGNLMLRINGANVTYDGPLTGLPALAPDEAYEIAWVLQSVPTPLPAGTYGTSFAVIP